MKYPSAGCQPDGRDAVPTAPTLPPARLPRGRAARLLQRGTLATAVLAALAAAASPVAQAGPKIDLYVTNSASGDPIHDITSLNRPDDQNDLPLIGDWDGNGKDEVGIYHPRTRQIVLNHRNTSDSTSTVTLGGNFGDVPLAGRWNKNLGRRDAIALYRPENRTLYYPTTSDEHRTDGEVQIGGNPGDVPIVGDWDGDGVDTLGLFRPGTVNGGDFYIKNDNRAGSYLLVAAGIGNPGDRPIVGDWNLDGRDTIGLFRPTTHGAPTFYMSNSSHGIISPGVSYGNPGDLPAIGGWDGDKEHTFGVFRPENHTFYMRQGDELPLEVRILAVADVFDALTTDRPYRRACTAADALAELDQQAGTGLDSRCVAALRDVLGQEQLVAIGQRARRNRPAVLAAHMRHSA